ncbi:hypothetical protein J8273_4808 [Carpediemonas membranifera]|uniref:Uncharacterized protein n=1 Tax=Carpediemonas membranifera TaxID=201153 RepID=A0A8J6B5U7_9EUKA|nr:hypothetical protein J8273_4808 [Carpediemonas membranifera]|eukprot:KAG9393689.1 hypothetical protein J8273_4808 [Carpediemonas membranifera]
MRSCIWMGSEEKRMAPGQSGPKIRLAGFTKFEKKKSKPYSYSRTAKLLERFKNRMSERKDAFGPQVERLTVLHATVKKIADVERAKKHAVEQTEEVELVE